MRSPMFASVNVPANYRAQPARSADGPHPKLRSPRSFLGLFHSRDLAAEDLLPSASLSCKLFGAVGFFFVKELVIRWGMSIELTDAAGDRWMQGMDK